MSWMQQLSMVYDNNKREIGKFSTRGEGQRFTLLPISHVTQSAQIEITLDRDGTFYRANTVPKNESSTIVPASLGSANRAGAVVAPHFLHDKLFYVAGDYLKYGGDSKRSDNFPRYIEQMQDWATSEWAHPRVKLIYDYVQQGTVIEDLVRNGILYVNDQGKLIEKWTSKESEKYSKDRPDIYSLVTGNSSEAFVRFNVLSESHHEPVVWEDTSLFQTFQIYYSAQTMATETKNGICYITGQEANLTERHGSRIRNAGDMSKLISSNDVRGFTYRGRFTTADQAVQISYDISQKAHNALRWLIQRQGFRADERSFITFGIQSPDVVKPFDATIDLFDDTFAFLSGSGAERDADTTNKIVAEQIREALKGKNHNFELDGVEDIVVMAVDAATRGRMSIVYYLELDSRLFLDQLTHWHATCRWHQSYYDDTNKKVIHYEGTPSTYRIVEAVYGPRGDVRIKKELYTRLLPCIVDGANIPKDIVYTLFNRVKNPMSFGDSQSGPSNEWQHTLNIACALVRKLYEQEEIALRLDENNHSRDYLFGRLLGVAEVLERRILNERNEKRATNAMRYFNAFSQHPARTWMVIRKQLHPYQVRHGDNLWYYNKLIRDIEDKITVKNMTNDALGPLFLIGYSSQIKRFYEKNNEKEANEYVDTAEQN